MVEYVIHFFSLHPIFLYMFLICNFFWVKVLYSIFSFIRNVQVVGFFHTIIISFYLALLFPPPLKLRFYTSRRLSSTLVGNYSAEYTHILLEYPLNRLEEQAYIELTSFVIQH